MKYYIFEYNLLNNKETGTQGQCTDIRKMGDIQNDSKLFDRYGRLKLYDFELPEPIMDTRAKQTTLLNVVAISFFLVLKDYFIDFLTQFDIGEYKNWPLKVYHKNNLITDYQLFIKLQPKQGEYIDFVNGEFYVRKFKEIHFVGDSIKMKDYDEYLNIRNEMSEEDQGYWLSHKNIVLNLSRAREDLFVMYNAPIGDWFASERLKNAIEEKKFTGMVFHEITERHNKVEVIY